MYWFQGFLFSMLGVTILFVVSFAASGTSVVIRPERFRGLESGSSYQYFTPDVQQDANNEAKVYYDKYSRGLSSKDEDEDGGNEKGQRKLDDEVNTDKEDLETLQDERRSTDDKTGAEGEEYNEDKDEEHQKNRQEDDEDDRSGKVVRENNADEESADESKESEERGNLAEDERDNEEINEAEGDENQDDKSNEKYENYEDHDAFKWPNTDKWSEEFGQYKGYDEFGDGHGYGKYGDFGDFGTFGKYSSDIRPYSHFGCLELGHGEYC